ncbi:MAG: N-acetylmuramoyl-L-alanine amidase [Candidatus Delongbacteria bacterium]|nr:N-acetylmuramoyl-L-alanine amidase [Candidatus Delongbacteria bacterium]
MREINEIVIHCSATDFGNAELFRNWHVNDNGWDDIGYHYVILNSYPEKKNIELRKPVFDNDGKIEIGRDISKPGAHVKNHNEDSIGICLVGNDTFSGKQFESLKCLISTLLSIYPNVVIKGHYEYDTAIIQGKTCPNIDMELLREKLKNKNS